MFFFVLVITNIVVEHRNSCQKSTFFFLLLPYTWLQVVSRSQATSGLQMLQQVARQTYPVFSHLEMFKRVWSMAWGAFSPVTPSVSLQPPCAKVR